MVTPFTPTDRFADVRDGGSPPNGDDPAGDDLEAGDALEARPTPAVREPETAACPSLETEPAVSRR
ncbi:hypothetical protein [Natronorubrum texcoconense]|uniref:Uncharacterized protein n=1 Tax=Natronorubrum texcoconense TaxID=1095776 RepID=A0A1G8VRD5_9EURY|nr:hypothetical protein [Natronorubrum texcoconense]SDJ68447.1 hypothetical protein SAMN04515672_1462 [Natronorubrum texcoconense]